MKLIEIYSNKYLMKLLTFRIGSILGVFREPHYDLFPWRGQMSSGISPVVLHWMNAILKQGAILEPLFSDMKIEFDRAYPLTGKILVEREGSRFLPCACPSHTTCSKGCVVKVPTEGTILVPWSDGGGFYLAIPRVDGITYKIDPLPNCYTPPKVLQLL